MLRIKILNLEQPEKKKEGLGGNELWSLRNGS